MGSVVPDSGAAADQSVRGLAPVLRIVVVLILAAALMWVTVGVTLTLVIGRSRPAAALSIWPFGAQALASAAAFGVADAKGDHAGSAVQARAALRREPGNVVALRALGVAEGIAGQPDYTRLFVAAERFSRRDLPTQLVLIETNVARGDIVGAILHYDRALRAGYGAYDMLFPVLVAASQDPQIAGPLARKLSERPAWWSAFVERAIQDRTPNPMLASLFRATRMRADRTAERPYLSAGLQRLIDQGDIAGAIRLYGDARGRAAGVAPLRDGGFEANEQLPPFEWTYTEESDLAGVREPAPTGGIRLQLFSANGKTGTIARQQLALVPGTYRVELVAGDIMSGGFAIEIRCNGTADDRPPLASTSLNAPSGGRRRIEMNVRIPAGCPGQILSVNAVGGGAIRPMAAGAAPWIDDVAIVPTGA